MVITAGLMLSLFLSSMESTVVATAMPTIVSQLGGLSGYSWVFAAYMLTSTTTVPLFGKLSDIYGRRPLFLAAMLLFLGGSLLCGMAQTMPQLIAFRAVQGIGAGGLLPLIFTMIGDLFSLEQRAKIQGLFSAVWGVSAVVGPLLGGFLVDSVSWRWVFLISIAPGLLACVVVGRAWQAGQRSDAARPAIDWAGAGLLTVGVVLLLIGLLDIQTPLGWAALGAAVLCGAALWRVERRAVDPVLPLRLFGDRVFAVACLHGLLAGCTLFGVSSYIPLYAQGVLGTDAIGAGSALTPMLLGWVAASIVSGRLIARVNARTLVLIGVVALMFGAVLLTQAGRLTSPLALGAALGLMGVGMGLSIPILLIAVQTSVARGDLGTATATVQFSRSIGGTIGVSIMGAVLSIGLNAQIAAAGLDPQVVDELLRPEGAGAQIAGGAQAALALALQGVFTVALIAAALTLVVGWFTPAGKVASFAVRRPPAPGGEEAAPQSSAAHL